MCAALILRFLPIGTQHASEAYLMTGDPKRTLPAVRRALELDPNNDGAQGMLEYLERKNR